jgi:hypothetical protein
VTKISNIKKKKKKRERERKDKKKFQFLKFATWLIGDVAISHVAN